MIDSASACTLAENSSNQRFETWLLDKARELKPLKTAVVHPVDNFSLMGAVEAAKAGIITPVLVGPEHKIRALAKELGVDISGFELLPTPHSHAAAETAVAMALEGKVEALMKGKLATDELMTPIMDKTNGLRTGRRMSHVFVLNVPRYPKPLFLTDSAINIRPTLMEKKDIVQNAADLFHTLGLGTPKVAILSAVEYVTERIPSTLDATALCKMAERGQITGTIVDGPLAFDNAVSKESAEIKGLHSEVAGDADILVVPDIESGNMLYKQLRYFSGAQGAGIVLGAKVPIILTSRSSDAGNRVASCALALLHTRMRKL
jgi:phosphate acetyltransferase